MDDKSMIALAGVVVACILAGLQWIYNKRQAKLNRTVDLILKFQDPEARNAQFAVRELIEKAENAGGFENLDTTERAQISSVATLFGIAGLLIDAKEVDENIFMSAYGSSVKVNFGRLQKYYVWNLDRHKKTTDSLWIAFSDLAERANKRT